MNRSKFIIKTMLATGGSCIVIPSVLKRFPNRKVTTQMLVKSRLDEDFMSLLIGRGIKDAANGMGIDLDEIFSTMIESANHLYRSYHWLVGRDEFNQPVIQALMPEVAGHNVRMVTIKPEQVADAILYAYSQPQSLNTREILLAPTRQQT